MIVSEFTHRRFGAVQQPEHPPGTHATEPLRRWRLAALHGMFGTAAVICTGHWRASTRAFRTLYQR